MTVSAIGALVCVSILLVFSVFLMVMVLLTEGNK